MHVINRNKAELGTYKIFNFIRLNLLRLGRVVQLPLLCCGSECSSYSFLAVNSDSDIISPLIKVVHTLFRWQQGPSVKVSPIR